jgi:hypothetical protein
VEALMMELDSHYRYEGYRQGRNYRGRHDRRPNYRGHHGADHRVRIHLPRLEIQWNWRH